MYYPVCEMMTYRFFLVVKDRDYWRCMNCLTTLLEPPQLPSANAEHAQYYLHHNDPGDAAYRQFLERFAALLLQRLLIKTHDELDYGHRPEPVLAAKLREGGHSVALFDPFFHSGQTVLACTYDFVTCSKVTENFHYRAQVFRKFNALLKPGSWLVLMNCFQTDDSRFASWYYRHDPTHAAFYRETTQHHLAQRFSWHCEFPYPNIKLLQKEF